MHVKTTFEETIYLFSNFLADTKKIVSQMTFDSNFQEDQSTIWLRAKISLPIS